MSRERPKATTLRQANACEYLGSPLYAALLRRVARETDEGGPCADALAAHADAPDGDAVPLRLLGGVHALVLSGRAPDLAAHYPSVGGVFDPDRPDAAWPAFRDAVAGHPEWIRDWLCRPPQTNEVGRASLLLTGLLWAVRESPLPVRLFAVGAGAGLNLRPDLFRYTSGEWAWGPADSPVTLADAWEGPVPSWLREPATLNVVHRGGCDLAPVDPATDAGALALRAYVWPDQAERAARLDGAIALARREPADVETLGAADHLAGVRLETGTLTVVWHSVMRQYVPGEEWTRVHAELDRLAGEATGDAAFAHLTFEPEEDGAFFLTRRHGRGPAERTIRARPHGLPARQVDTALAPHGKEDG